MKKLLIFLTLLAFLASCTPVYTCPTYAGASHNGKMLKR